VQKNQDGSSTLIWKDGLLVNFDKEDLNAVTMIFSMPQQVGSGAPAPPGTPPAPRPGPVAPKQ